MNRDIANLGIIMGHCREYLESEGLMKVLKSEEKRMGKIYKNIEELIGHTPLVQLCNLERENGLQARLLVKLEYLNPAGSVKDRAAGK